MLLSNIQSQLAAVYETPVHHDVADFLITDAELAHTLENPSERRQNRERLLVHQQQDELSISLFIDAKVMHTLNSQCPFGELDQVNLNEFLIALEGVSHFHYLTWHATHERQVTQLELEIQAEVDKYITAMMLLDEQARQADLQQLHERLFDDVLFDTSLDETSSERYREANHYAAKYCQHLVQQFPAQHREPSFMNSIRRFYRLSQNNKIREINSH